MNGQRPKHEIHIQYNLLSELLFTDAAVALKGRDEII